MKLYSLRNIFLSALALTALAACSNDDDNDEPVTPEMMDPDFSGTYAQADHMGRPGINTVLSSADFKDQQNVTIVSEMQEAFQGPFLDQAVALHAAYGAEYENNILGLDAVTLTSVLADDVLEVAPDNVTTYFLPGEDADGDGNVLNDPAVIGLTGRTPQDDVIDVSLILIFGGMDGIRFSGQDDGNGGTLPILNSDGVGFSADVSTSFPYLGNPE